MRARYGEEQVSSARALLTPKAGVNPRTHMKTVFDILAMNNAVLRDTFMFISDSSVGSLTDQQLLAIVVGSHRVGHFLFGTLHGARRRSLSYQRCGWKPACSRKL